MRCSEPLRGLNKHWLLSSSAHARSGPARLFSHALQTLNQVIVAADLRPRTRLQQLEWGRLWKSRRRIAVGSVKPFLETFSLNISLHRSRFVWTHCFHIFIQNWILFNIKTFGFLLKLFRVYLVSIRLFFLYSYYTSKNHFKCFLTTYGIMYYFLNNKKLQFILIIDYNWTSSQRKPYY